jgi:phosphoribosylglycinamide formyltransferase-1
MIVSAMEDDVSDRARPTIGELISGRGSNLQALIDAVSAGTLAADIRLVISNRAGAAGLARAAAAGIETLVLSHRTYANRAAFDRALLDALKAHGVTVVCLAGFMRLLGPEFCAAFPDAVLNIHPSLLPAFPGVDAQRQALEHGVKVTGATVHFVTPELDAGPIVMQAAVPVRDDDTAESLSARVLEVEHAIYPAALQRVLHEPWRIVGRRVVFTA